MPFLQAAEVRLAEEREKRLATEERTAALALGLTEAVAVISDRDARLAVCSLDALPLCLLMVAARHNCTSAALVIRLLGSSVVVMLINGK